MREIQHTVPGNAEVIDGLLRAAERAAGTKIKSIEWEPAQMPGMARCAAIVFCEHAGADIMYLGDVHARAQVVYGCELMKHLLVTSTSLNTRPLQETRPANQVRYDLTSDPICFDFMPWLVTAKMKMLQEKCPGPLQVAFVRHPGSLTNVSEQKWAFFNNVMRPTLELFGVVESADAQNGRHEEFVGLRDISTAYLSGIEVPRIQVPEIPTMAVRKYFNGMAPVTITLRETVSFEHRDSNLEEWKKFARWLQKQGEHVIIVRDTCKADEPLEDFPTAPECSKNLHMRAALYEQAKCNMFVTNGPWGLAYFGSKPWLMFASIDEGQPEAFNRPSWWNMFMGLNTQRQLPWASPQQRIVYQPDTFDNMRAAYEELRLAS